MKRYGKSVLRTSFLKEILLSFFIELSSKKPFWIFVVVENIEKIWDDPAQDFE